MNLKKLLILFFTIGQIKSEPNISIDIGPWPTDMGYRPIDINEKRIAKNYTVFYPGCYDSDSEGSIRTMNIAVDYGLIRSKGKKINKYVDDLMSEVSDIYKNQFNVNLKYKLIKGSKKDKWPLSMTKQRCLDAVTVFYDFREYVRTRGDGDSVDYWLFLSQCFKGVLGVSYIGTICTSPYNMGVSVPNSRVMAHEIGHGFGAQHTFGLGGVMDYMDGKYNGVVQFHPANREQVCVVLDRQC